jgi:hypothetical protein
MTEPEELIDEDGYPTEEALDHLKTFHGTGAEVVAYIRSLMNNGASMREDFVDGYGRNRQRPILVTGGWSGCEQVVSALQETIFYLAGWESSFRGGKHTFTFDAEKLALSMYWGDPASSTQKS